MTRLFWMSFADDHGFRGACLVAVTDADLQRLGPDVRAIIRTIRGDGSPIDHGDVDLAVAVRVSHEKGINPGGQVLSQELPGDSAFAHFVAIGFELDRLYTQAELLAFPDDEFGKVTR